MPTCGSARLPRAIRGCCSPFPCPCPTASRRRRSARCSRSRATPGFSSAPMDRPRPRADSAGRRCEDRCAAGCGEARQARPLGPLRGADRDGARGRAGSFPRRPGGARPCARVARDRVACRPRPRQRAGRRRQRPAAAARDLALLERAALRGVRPLLPGADTQPVLVQLAGRRVRQLPWLRAHHRDRLRPGRSRRDASRCAAAP